MLTSQGPTTILSRTVRAGSALLLLIALVLSQACGGNSDSGSNSKDGSISAVDGGMDSTIDSETSQLSDTAGQDQSTEDGFTDAKPTDTNSVDLIDTLSPVDADHDQVSADLATQPETDVTATDTNPVDLIDTLSPVDADDDQDSADIATQPETLTVCTPDQYESSPPTATADRVCKDLTVCSDVQYESKAPTATSDRECTPLTNCKDDEYESKVPTPTSDRECTKKGIQCEPCVNKGSCAADHDCVTVSHTAVIKEKVCARRCDKNTDCDSGYRCGSAQSPQIFGYCWPSHYLTNGNHSCKAVNDAGKSCSSSGDCGLEGLSDGVCSSLQNNICVLLCRKSSDCVTGSTCGCPNGYTPTTFQDILYCDKNGSDTSARCIE